MAGSRRLLIVEDDPGLNALITRKLKQAGFQVEPVLNGAAALDSVRRDPNVLLLLDYLLPDMTASEIIEKLSAEGKEAPFVVMTGHGDEKVAVELMKLGALDYLIKDTDLGIALPEVMRRAFRMVEAEERLATTEATLRVSEERFRTTFENASVGMSLTMLDTRFITVNRAFSGMLGYTERELAGRNTSAVTHPDDAAMSQEAVRSLLAGEVASRHFEKRYLHKDGHVIWADLSTSLVLDADGAPLHFIELIQDITERKRAEQILHESEQRYRTLAQNIPAIVYRVHLRDRNRMAFFNDMLGMMTGYREDELRRDEVCSIDPLILPEDRASVVETVKRAVSESRPFQVDYRITHRDGTIRHFSEQGRPVPGADGRPEYIDGVIFDATEVRLSAEIVKLNQERLAEAQRTSHLGSWLWDIRAQQSFWSAELFRILGLEPDSVPPTQESFMARVHPDDRAYFEARAAEATRNRTSYDYDLRVVRPDGAERFIHGETNVEYDAAGEPVVVSGTCQDVTERRQAEAALHESEERYRNLFTNAPIGMYRTRPDGTVLVVNPALVRMMRYGSAAELLRCNLESEGFSPRFDRARFKAQLEREGEMLGLEAEWVRADGSPLLVRENARVVRDAKGQVLYYEGTIEDITERKKTEQALRESEERFRRIAENVPDGLVVVEGKRVSFANHRIEEIFGHSPEEIRRAGMLGPIAPEDRAQIVKTVAENVKRGMGSFDLEYRIVRKDGTRRWVRCRYAQGCEPGQSTDHYVVMTDITERKRAADALARQYKLTEALIDSPEDILIFALDREYRYTAFNEPHRREIRKVYGVEIKVGMDMLEVINIPEVRQKAKQSLDRVLAGENFTEVQEQPGLSISYEFTWNPIRAGKGKVVGIAAFVRDITERRRADEQLRRYSEDMALLNRLDAGINRGDSLDAIVALLAAETRKSFGGRGATLFLLSEDRQYLELMNMELSGNEVQKVEQVLGVGMPKVRVVLKPGGFHATVLETGLTRILSNAQEVERWAGEMTESPLIRKLVPTFQRLLGFNSVMLAPLAISGRTIGVLTAARGEPFREPDLRRFSAIAEQMAVAIGRKLADDALKASEEKYRLVVEHANEAILVHQDDRVRFANSRTREVLGRGPEEIQDQPFPQFIHPDDRTEVVERYQKRLRGEPVPERYTFRIVRKDGAVRRVEGSSALTEWRGQPATVSFLSDVTERELAAEQEALRRRDKAFLAETAVEFVRLGEQYDIYQHICSRLHMLVGDAYVVVNSHDLKNGEFQVRAVAGLGNRLDTVLKLMGRKPEGTVFTLTPEERQGYASDKLKRIEGGLAGLSFGKLPKRLSALLEKTFNIGEVYAMTLFHQGAILGSVNILLRREAVLRDPEVVETFVNQAAVALQRRLAEDELRRHQQHLEELVEERTKELEQVQDALVRQERLAATGKVAGSMAHEIRNPLAAMRNATYFLTDSLGPKLDEKEARHLEIVNHEIDVTNSIITSVLDFARGRPAEMVPLNLTDVLDIAQERANLPRGIQVQRGIPSDLPMVRVDLQQIVQVFLNLLVNASQAMDGEGRITVLARKSKVKRSEVEKSEAGQELKSQNSEVKSEELVVEVRFHDEGPGIAPENLKRVFEPLFSTKAVGIGMGLAVCKAFVESCHGTIEVESEPGKGTTFTVTLPAVTSE